MIPTRHAAVVRGGDPQLEVVEPEARGPERGAIGRHGQPDTHVQQARVDALT
jgi:hypothetical protein